MYYFSIVNIVIKKRRKFNMITCTRRGKYINEDIWDKMEGGHFFLP